MKKVILFFLIITTLNSFAQTVKFSSATPEPGKPLKFIYDPKGGSLEKLANISCSVIAFSNRDKRITIPVVLNKLNDLYEGEFTPSDSTNFAVFVFKAGITTDENPNGYFTKLYKNGKATPMSIFLEGHLFSGFGKVLAKTKIDLPLSIAKYKQAFDADPNLQKKYLKDYLSVQYALDKAKGEKQINETIAFYNKNEPSEQNFFDIISLYQLMKNTGAVDSVYSLIKTKYPRGSYTLSQAISGLRAYKEANAKEEKFNQIIKDFKLDLNNKQDLSRVTYTFLTLAEAFFEIKNYDKAEFYLDKCDQKLTSTILYNKYAQKNISTKQDLRFAERIAKKAVDILEELKNEKVPSAYNSKENYLEVLEEYQTTYRLTYLTVLGLLEKNMEALAIVETASHKANFSNAEMNTIYVNMLLKNGKKEEAFKFAEQFVKKGQENKQLMADLKIAYQGTLPFDVYYGNLQKESNDKIKTKFLEEMINIPAPKFALNNLKGEKVELDKLKGKVVIIDYWATWCGPCIASFPGMQLAVNKYKNDPNVVFLFINSWEKGEDREKAVREWVKENPQFTFNYLLDTRSAKDPANYDVIEKYNVDAIPSKFIVDEDGNIRFKRRGSENTPEAIAKELNVMIELVKVASKKVGK